MKLLFILVFFSMIMCVNGQKKRVKADSEAPPKPPPVKKNSAVTTNAAAKYVAIVEIDESSKIKVSFEDLYYLESYSDKTAWAENLFSSLNSKNQKPNLSEIIFRPSMNLSFGELSDVIKKIRNSANQPIKVQIDNDISAEISKPLIKTVKPNPLFLLVNLTADGKVSLNNEPLGSIDELSKLQNLLMKVFDDRTNNGVFREGTNEVDKEVFIIVPDSTKMPEIKKLAKGLIDAGANPIGLQIDDFVRTTSVEEIAK